MNIYTLLENLSHAIEKAPAIALGASFLWGVLSVVLSPCHLSSIPLIVGFIIKRGTITLARIFCLSSSFAAGIFITIILIGLISASFGRLMGDTGTLGNVLVVMVFILVGLYFLDVIKAPNFGITKLPVIHNDITSALLLGLIFGIASGPCTFAYMAPVLALVFKISSKEFIYAGVMLIVYAVGHCSTVIFAGTCVKAIQKYFNLTEKSKGIIITRRICGILLLISSFVYLISETLK